jgi:D-alanyl-D-alanine carboxypeptidase
LTIDGYRLGMRTRLLTLAVLVSVVAAGDAQGPDPAIKARIDGFIQALNAGAEPFEVMAQESYAPAFLARRTPAERRQFVERLRADFGAIAAPRVTGTPDGAMTLHVRGATGLEGRIELQLEPVPPHRITRIAIEVGDRDEGPATAPPPPVNGSMSDVELSRALDVHVSALAATDTFSGVVLVAKSGTPVFEKAWGLADRDRRTPNAVTTRFNLGSINKIITKTAVAKLMSEGRLALTDTIATLLPDYPNVAARTATVSQLLEHRAGIANFFGPGFSEAPKSQLRSNADYYNYVAPMPLLFEPGTRRQYCNGCYVVLGAIIERLSGMTYEDYVARHVFAPAGMMSAGAFRSDALPSDTARGYTRRGRANDTSLVDSAAMHGVAGSAAGGGYASARDLLAFDVALRSRRLLDAKTTAWMLGGESVMSGRSGGSLGVAGGAPGVNAVLESSETWTVVVMGNLDPPAAERLGVAIHRQLTR